jgi:acetyl-CoA carboxylase biotin carboxyl carrier protein
MALSEKEILQVLEMFQKSDWQDLHLESGGVRLNISKNGRAASRAFTSSPAPAAEGRTAQLQAPAPAAVHAPPPAAGANAGVAIDPRWMAVKAPMLGTFYAAPKPGAPPFVALGQHVGAEDNVCIIEVMKLMNYVKAGAAGKVVHVAVSNGDLVEFDQALVYIDPT